MEGVPHPVNDTVWVNVKLHEEGLQLVPPLQQQMGQHAEETMTSAIPIMYIIVHTRPFCMYYNMYVCIYVGLKISVWLGIDMVKSLEPRPIPAG